MLNGIPRAVEVYAGSDGELTRSYYSILEAVGPIGIVALNLFRAQKCSARAKVYRGGIRGKGSFKRMAYDRKSWSMQNLCRALSEHGGRLGITWGWKEDSGQDQYDQVLYVDLPQGQVSFHSPTRFDGPEYLGDWDGARKSAERIIQFCDAVCSGKNASVPCVVQYVAIRRCGMLNATFRPLVMWPGSSTPAGKRKRAPFRAGYQRTLDDLERELGHLKARSVVIQLGIESRDIRNDGWPRSSARPKEPGVVVSFQSGHGPLHFACDTYQSWEDNLRAISLTMEALRAVNRYGAVRGNEQYKGFAQLEPPGRAGEMDASEASLFLAEWSGMPVARVTHASILDEAYKRAALKLHPDCGGSHELFVKLKAARDLLRGGSRA